MAGPTTARRTRGGNSRFASIPPPSVPRSVFDRSHGHKTTFDSGFLIPIFCDEVLPGDTHSVRLHAFARMATLLKPLMDRVYLDFFFFFVPYRLVWSNFKRFMGEEDPNPGSTTDFLMPTCTAGGAGYATNSLHDYFGIPISVGAVVHQNLPLRAYNLIHKEWFRDENLVDSPVIDLDDGPDDPADYVLLRRGKRHDYFTACLPFAQKGDAVTLSFGGTAPLQTTGTGVPTFELQGTPASTGSLTVSASNIVQTTGGWGSAGDVLEWTDPALEADLSAATGQTINAIRQAFQVQRLFERDARGGTRYTEITRAHFGVISPDHRLQRPEYLGGGSTQMNAHPVPITAQRYAGSSQDPGELVGYATGQASGIGFNASFTEHGVIIGLVMARAELTYQQGLHRMWSRSTRFDHFWPSFQHLGEQEVLSKELYLDGSPSDDDIFGYQERYAEYRYKPSQITGEFRSQSAAPIDVWHLAQEFATRPTLDQAFIEEDPPIDRVIAVVDEPQFIFDSWFEVKSVRPMPTYGVPGLVDHF